MPADILTGRARGGRARGAAWPLFSLALLMAVWTLASALIQSDLLPSPLAVWEAFQRELRLGYIEDMAATLGRVAAAFLLAMTIGSVNPKPIYQSVTGTS